MQFKWTVAARGAKWTANYDEVATKIMQHAGWQSPPLPYKGATTPVSALDLIKGAS